MPEMTKGLKSTLANRDANQKVLEDYGLLATPEATQAKIKENSACLPKLREAINKCKIQTHSLFEMCLKRCMDLLYNFNPGLKLILDFSSKITREIKNSCKKGKSSNISNFYILIYYFY